MNPYPLPVNDSLIGFFFLYNPMDKSHSLSTFNFFRMRKDFLHSG